MSIRGPKAPPLPEWFFYFDEEKKAAATKELPKNLIRKKLFVHALYLC